MDEGFVANAFGVTCENHVKRKASRGEVTEEGERPRRAGAVNERSVVNIAASRARTRPKTKASHGGHGGGLGRWTKAPY